MWRMTCRAMSARPHLHQFLLLIKVGPAIHNLGAKVMVGEELLLGGSMSSAIKAKLLSAKRVQITCLICLCPHFDVVVSCCSLKLSC